MVHIANIYYYLNTILEFNILSSPITMSFEQIKIHLFVEVIGASTAISRLTHSTVTVRSEEIGVTVNFQ